MHVISSINTRHWNVKIGDAMSIGIYYNVVNNDYFIDHSKKKMNQKFDFKNWAKLKWDHTKFK